MIQALAAQGHLAEALGIYGRLSECLRDELGVSPIIFGSPMGASGFEQLVGHFTDRTVITYDPRGMERSTREPGSNVTVEAHAEDYHRVVEAVGLGSVDAFGSSGGGMCGLHWLVPTPKTCTPSCHTSHR